MQRLSAAVALLAVFPASSYALTTFGSDPSTYISLPNNGYNGVVSLSVGCSGSVLSTGMHILTAAHCVDEGVTPGSITVNVPFGGGSLVVSAIFIEPNWSGQLLAGNDIAVLLLASPAGVTGYSLYTLFDEVGQTVDLAGYGQSGNGSTGATTSFGTLRNGQNIYDTTSDIFTGGSPNILVGDFDNGLAENDAFGTIDSGLAQTGVGLVEVMLGPGDSGGPTLLNGMIVGVHSFRGTITPPPGPSSLPDIDDSLNSSFGEVFGDTRVSAHEAWLESILVPEPATYLLTGLGLLFIASRKRLRNPVL